MDDQAIPYNLEDELTLLSHVLLEPTVFPAVRENLGPRDFYSEANSRCYQAICNLNDRNIIPDPYFLREELRALGIPNPASLVDYLLDGLRTHNPLVLAKRIKEAAGKRAFLQGVYKATEGLHEKSLEVLTSETSDIASHLSTYTQCEESFQSLAVRVFEQIGERVAEQQEVTGVPSGFYELDQLTSGWQPGTLSILAARPSMGKTAFALNCAQNAAIRHGKRVVVISLEMTRDQLMCRLYSRQASIPGQQIKTGKLSAEEMLALSSALAIILETPLHVIDSESGIETLVKIETKLRRLCSNQETRPDLLIIDYLQLMSFNENQEFDNRNLEIGKISRKLKKLAVELGLPIIVLSQLSRGVESRQNKRPMLADLRDSGSIEQDADLVLFIYRDEYYNQADTTARGEAEIIIAKHRSGPTGTVNLRFIPEHCAFWDLEKSRYSGSKYGGIEHYAEKNTDSNTDTHA